MAELKAKTPTTCPKCRENTRQALIHTFWAEIHTNEVREHTRWAKECKHETAEDEARKRTS